MLGATMLPPVSLPTAKADQTRGRGRARTGAGSGGAFLEQPGIHGLSAEPNIVEGQRSQAELGDQYGAGFMKALNHGGIFAGLRFLKGSAP